MLTESLLYHNFIILDLIYITSFGWILTFSGFFQECLDAIISKCFMCVFWVFIVEWKLVWGKKWNSWFMLIFLNICKTLFLSHVQCCMLMQTTFFSNFLKLAFLWILITFYLGYNWKQTFLQISRGYIYFTLLIQ